MLQRAGLLAEEDASRAVARAQQRGAGMAAVLVELGLAGEDQLVGFLQSKLMIPQVSSSILSALERPASEEVGADVAWRHELLPVSVDDVGNMTLAMSDPTDVPAIDAVVDRTRAYIVRAVAPRTALLRALHRFYGPNPNAEAERRVRVQAGTLGGNDPSAWPQAGDASPPNDAVTTAVVTPAGTTEPPGAPREVYDSGVNVAVRPGSDAPAPDPSTIDPHSPPRRVAPPGEAPPVRTGVTAPPDPRPDPMPPRTPDPAPDPAPQPMADPPLTPNLVDDDTPPLSASAFGRVIPRLVESHDRDEITQVLMEFLAEGFSRVIMFVNLQGTLRGRDARGDDMLVEAVRQVRIPTSGPSTFKSVIESGRPYFGLWRTDTRINARFGEAMDGIRGNVLLLPVKLGDRVPVLVFASGTPHPVDPRSLDQLVDGVAAALERLILRRKSRDNLTPIG